MWKDISPSDSEKSLENWNQSVIKARGEYSARLKSARRTKENACLSWPSPIASEVRQGFQDRSRGMKGSQESLTTVVVKDAANWPTPAEQDGKQGGITPFQAKGGNHTNLLHIAAIKSTHGQAAPANPSTDGSRQGSWATPECKNHVGYQVDATGAMWPRLGSQVAQWATPNTMDCLPSRSYEAMKRQATNGGRKNRSKPGNLREQIDPLMCQAYEDAKKEANWPTITANTPDMESNGPNGHSGTYLAGAVKAEENWVTPRTSGTSTRPNKTTPRQGLTLIEQAREQEKMWRTPSVAEEKNQNTSTQIYLQNQVGATPKAWATPQLQDGHNINQDSTTHKTIPAQLTKMNMSGKLNPRWVETLMGLPVGWVMPSCKSPVTIEPTNCDSSATESCLPQPSELLEF